MAPWWKRWQDNTSAKQEAAVLLRDYGERAYQMAIQRARKARNERNPKRARHYSAVAWHVANGPEASQSIAPITGANGDCELEKPTSNVVPAYSEV
jgi:hypothetical protein